MEPSSLSHPARLAGASLLRVQSDARLTTLAAAGHVAAFDAIVSRYRARLVRFCGGIVGRDRAEDAVQQTLVNVHTSLISSHDPPRDLQAWMLSIARNASLNLLRGEREAAVLTDREPAREDERPDLVAERTEWLRSTFSAVAALPEAQRDAIVLRELQGCSHEEIAAALGVTTGAARQHLFRARAALRAGVTALTPQPLLIRLIEWGSSPDAVGMTTQLGNVLVRSVAGLLAATAVAGGVVGSGVLTHVRHRVTHDSADAAQAASPSGSGAGGNALLAGTVPGLPGSGAAGLTLAGFTAGRGAGPSGTGSDGGHGHSGSSASSGPGSSGSGSSGSGKGSSGSGKGSGESGDGSGSGHGSGSGEDSSGSGRSGSGEDTSSGGHHSGSGDSGSSDDSSSGGGSGDSGGSDSSGSSSGSGSGSSGRGSGSDDGGSSSDSGSSGSGTSDSGSPSGSGKSDGGGSGGGSGDDGTDD